MSETAAFWGAIEGVMPVKLMGPPVMIVMVPMASRVTSVAEVATMGRLAGEFVFVVSAGVMLVGTVAGAVKVAALGFLGSGVVAPQVGLQALSWGKGMVEGGTGWVMSQVTRFVCRS